MHKFILNIGSLNLAHYGMLLYPEQSGYSASGNTLSLVEVASLEQLPDSLRDIADYIRLHPFRVEEFVVCICVRLSDLNDPRSNWLYFQMAADFFRNHIERLVGQCVGVTVFVHALVPEKNMPIPDALEQENLFGYIDGCPAVYPSFTEAEWTDDNEEKLPDLCSRACSTITDQISREFYVPIFERISAESRLLCGTVETDAVECTFTETDFIEGEASSGSVVAEHRLTACLKDRFADIYEERLRQLRKQDVRIVVREIVRHQPSSEIQEGVLLAAYLVSPFTEPYHVFADHMLKSGTIGPMLSGYRNRLESLEVEIPECRPQDSKLSDWCVPMNITIHAVPQGDSSLFGDLGRYRDSFKKGRMHDNYAAWKVLDDRLQADILAAEERLQNQANDCSVRFQRGENIGLVREYVSDIYSEKKQYELDAAELRKKLADTDAGFVSIRQLLRAMQDVENESDLIARVAKMKDSFWIGGFLLVLLTAFLALAIPYLAEQNYVFSTTQGTYTYFAYVFASLLLNLLAWPIVAAMLNRIGRKHTERLIQSLTDFRAHYEHAAVEYAQRLTDILQLEALSQRLRLINRAEEEQQLLTRKWGWHRVKLREHLRSLEHFDALMVRHFGDAQEHYEIDPDQDVIHNEAYWLIPKEEHR